MAKNVLLEHVEDIMDARAAEKAHVEYLADLVTYSHEKVGRRLGLIK